jgi:hypothetical protein
MSGAFFRTHCLVQRGGPGLSCDDEGLALGPITLAMKAQARNGRVRYQLLSPDGIGQVLRLAYGSMPEAEIERRHRAIARITQLLDEGAHVLARIYAVLMGFPEIAPDAMAKLAIAPPFQKYNAP